MTKRNIGDEIIQGLEGALRYLDGENADAVVHSVQVPDEVNVRAIRQHSGLSQDRFAERYGFKVSALRDWEQGRRHPDRTARILLTVIARNPRAVEEALSLGDPRLSHGAFRLVIRAGARIGEPASQCL